MNIINSFDTDMNFWELYPDLKFYKDIGQLYKSDKSRNKEVSSKKMWFVVLTTALNSKYINVPQEERYEVIGEDFMNDINFFRSNSKVLLPLMDNIKTLCDTPSQRHLRQWTITLEDRTSFLESVNYDLNNYKQLDDMAANTAKFMETFKKINELISKELAGGGTVKGGGQESLADKGEI